MTSGNDKIIKGSLNKAICGAESISANLLAEHLVVKGHLTKQSIDRANRAMLDTGENFGDVVTRLGLLSETDLVNAYKSVLCLDKVDKTDFPSPALTLDGFSPRFLVASRALLIQTTAEPLQIAVANPLDRDIKRAIEYVTGKSVEYLVAPASEIDIAIEEQASVSSNGVNESEIYDDSELDDLEKLKDMASEAPVIRYVNRLLQRAVSLTASDIHIEPMEASLSVRLRIDGLLEHIESPSNQLKSAIVSRIKIIAGLDIAEQRLPQDGRITQAIQGRDVDFRVSTTPTLFGESIVLRILNQKTLKLDLDTLGFQPAEQAKFNQVLNKPNGIVLVTGPTGRVKTTTLYTAINILNQRSRKILTIEDPVEYMLQGINQVQVNNTIGLSFAKALRSFLRQDPDIMMVGEIRDYETAQIAVQASLTGHLILSTLHTNSAAAAIARLLDMGVEDFLLASTMEIILAQRLLRKLCHHCKTTKDTKPNATSLYNAKGCEKCQHTGFRGRTMVVEILVVSSAIKDLIRQRATVESIQQQAIKEGMKTLQEKGQNLVIQGITSREEVARVLGDTNNEI